MTADRLTVLMPVYNAAAHIGEAIESLLGQTYRQFVLLIIDDGCTDDTIPIIRSFNDSRIVVLHNAANIGLTASLNKGIIAAETEYIARMDSDDICLPQRFERQINLLDSHPEIDVCGSWLEVFGDKDWIQRYPSDSEAIKCCLLFYCALAHPSVMLRRQSLLTNHLLYDERFSRAQDYDLWVRSARSLRLANLPEILLRYRLHGQQASSLNRSNQHDFAKEIRIRQLNSIGIDPTPEQLELHEALGLWQIDHLHNQLSQVREWLQLLLEANQKARYYPDRALRKMLSEMWFRLCYSAKKKDIGVRRAFFRGSLLNGLSLRQKAFFWYKMIK